MLGFINRIKDFKKYNHDDNFISFRASYWKTFNIVFGITVCFGQLFWFIKDMTLLDTLSDKMLIDFLCRAFGFLFVPFYFSKRIKQEKKWIISFLISWAAALFTLLLNSLNFANNGYTGDGWVSHYFLFFAISIFSSNQICIYLTYILLTLLIIFTSSQFGGSINYIIPIMRPITTALIMTCGFVAVSIMFRKVIISLYKKECKLKDISKKDYLTGLYNRTIIQDLIDSNEILHKPGTLFIIDIDKFKLINDAYGHMAGDDAILFTSQVLTDSVKKSDTVIRYGGDEFLIITKGLVDEKTIYNQIEKRLESEENVYNVTFSVGSYRSINENIYESIKKADKAAYKSKSNGRARLTIFEEL